MSVLSVSFCDIFQIFYDINPYHCDVYLFYKMIISKEVKNKHYFLQS